MNYPLLDLLEDRLGLRNVVDNLAVKRQLWERQDRTPDTIEDQEAQDNLTLLEGEREKEEIYKSMRTEPPPLRRMSSFRKSRNRGS